VWDKSILGVKGIGENSGGFAQYLQHPRRYLCLCWLRSRELLQKLEAGKTLPITPAIWLTVLDVPLDVDLEDCKLKGFDRTILEPILRKVRVQIF